MTHNKPSLLAQSKSWSADKTETLYCGFSLLRFRSYTWYIEKERSACWTRGTYQSF